MNERQQLLLCLGHAVGIATEQAIIGGLAQVAANVGLGKGCIAQHEQIGVSGGNELRETFDDACLPIGDAGLHGAGIDDHGGLTQQLLGPLLHLDQALVVL